MKYYCVPSREYREEVVKDLKLILKRELRESFDFLDSQLQGEFLLTDMKKKTISDLIQIRFSTVSLMFSQGSSIDYTYDRFFELNHNKAAGKRKAEFVESLRINFRMSNSKVDENKQILSARAPVTSRSSAPKVLQQT